MSETYFLEAVTTHVLEVPIPFMRSDPTIKWSTSTTTRMTIIARHLEDLKSARSLANNLLKQEHRFEKILIWKDCPGNANKRSWVETVSRSDDGPGVDTG